MQTMCFFFYFSLREEAETKGTFIPCHYLDYVFCYPILHHLNQSLNKQFSESETGLKYPRYFCTS